MRAASFTFRTESRGEIHSQPGSGRVLGMCQRGMRVPGPVTEETTSLFRSLIEEAPGGACPLW